MADRTAPDPAVSRLLDGMLEKPLWAMVRRVVDPGKLDTHLRAHLEWMIARERDGSLFASGPLHDADDRPSGGLTILRAPDHAAARRLADDDPFVREGAITYELHRWTLMEGGFRLSVRFSDGSYTLD